MKTLMQRVLWSCICLALISSSAWAVNIQTFRPNVGTQGTFRLMGSAPTQPMHVRTGIYGNFMHDPLKLRSTTGTTVRSIVRMGATVDAAAEFGLHKYVALGTSVPLSFTRHLANDGSTLRNAFSVGDVLAYAKVAILHPDDFPVGMSITPYVEAPSGSLSKYTGEQGIAYGATLAVDKQVGDFYIVGNVGYRGRKANDEVVSVTGFPATLNLDDELTYGLGASYQVIPQRLDVVGEFVGATAIQEFAQNRNTSPLEFDLGVRSHFHEQKGSVVVGGGLGVIRGYSAPMVRAFAGLQYEFGGDRAPVAEEPEEFIVRKTIDLEGVHFKTGGHDITHNAQMILSRNLQILHEEPDLQIMIEGHTDDRGNDDFNQRLSERRADSVKSYFVRQGIAANRLHAIGHGESQPIAPNDTEANMAKNRRVVITILEYR